MNKATISAVALRLSLGWFMFFAGIEKVLDPAWSAKGFLLSAKTFSDLYAWFAEPMNLVWVNPLNAWGLTLIGLALFFGVAVRPAALAGIILMVLYYFPQNVFPHVAHGYIVDEHVIYAFAFAVIAFFPLARRFGLGERLQGTFLGRIPFIRSLI